LKYIRGIWAFLKVVGIVAAGVLFSPAAAMFCSTDANTAIPDGTGSTGGGAPASISIVVPPSFGGTVI